MAPESQQVDRRPALLATAIGHEQGRGLWADARRRLRRNPIALFCLVVVALMVVSALFANWLAPYGFAEQNLHAVRQAPSWVHPFGTDEFGRDLLSRIIWGARTATTVAVLSVGLGLALGVLFGALSGYFGGWVDTAIMRVADLLFAFPGMLLAILLAATVRPTIDRLLAGWERSLGMGWLGLSGFGGFMVVILALTVVGWPGLARLIRGQVLALREKEFVEAARAIGCSEWRIIWRHILPNTVGLIVVVASMSLGGAVLAESTLSFLGIGVQPPQASWGNMINDSYRYWRTPEAHLLFIPGAIVALVVLSFNMLGDLLNDVLNPTTKG